MHRIAITTSSFGECNKNPVDLLMDNGFDVIMNPFRRTLKGNEIVDLCKGCIGIIAGTEVLNARALESLTQSMIPVSDLKVISRCGAGLDNVALDAARNLGIKVFNTPDAPTLAVAELTVGLILNLLRKISYMDRNVRSEHWKKSMGNILSGKKVGIIGFGRIGKKVAGLLKALGCKVRYYDVRTEVSDCGTERVELDELLKSSDIVSIHVSLKELLIGDVEINKMKKGAYLINVSRGGVVKEEALYAALKNGHLSGAAIDVFEQEPYSGPLKELDSAILTPHIGSYALETRVEMEEQAVENLLKGLKEAGI